MYAIIETGGKQYKVKKDDRLEIEKLPVKTGKSLSIDKVLMVVDGDNVNIGRPYLKDAKVLVEVKRETKGKKVITFKYRRRKSSKVRIGHRQSFSSVVVKDIKSS